MAPQLNVTLKLNQPHNGQGNPWSGLIDMGERCLAAVNKMLVLAKASS